MLFFSFHLCVCVFFFSFVHGEIREVINRSKSKSKHTGSRHLRITCCWSYIPGRNSCHRGSTFSGTKAERRKKRWKKKNESNKKERPPPTLDRGSVAGYTEGCFASFSLSASSVPFYLIIGTPGMLAISVPRIHFHFGHDAMVTAPHYLVLRESRVTFN